MAFLAEEIVHSKLWTQDTGRATSREVGKSRSHERLQRSQDPKSKGL